MKLGKEIIFSKLKLFLHIFSFIFSVSLNIRMLSLINFLTHPGISHRCDPKRKEEKKSVAQCFKVSYERKNHKVRKTAMKNDFGDVFMFLFKWFIFFFVCLFVCFFLFEIVIKIMTRKSILLVRVSFFFLFVVAPRWRMKRMLKELKRRTKDWVLYNNLTYMQLICYDSLYIVYSMNAFLA